MVGKKLKFGGPALPEGTFCVYRLVVERDGAGSIKRIGGELRGTPGLIVNYDDVFNPNVLVDMRQAAVIDDAPIPAPTPELIPESKKVTKAATKIEPTTE